MSENDGDVLAEIKALREQVEALRSEVAMIPRYYPYPQPYPVPMPYPVYPVPALPQWEIGYTAPSTMTGGTPQ